MMHLLKNTSSCLEQLVKIFRLGGLPLLFAVISLLAHETHASADRLDRMERPSLSINHWEGCVEPKCDRRRSRSKPHLCNTELSDHIWIENETCSGAVCTSSGKPKKNCRWCNCNLEPCSDWPVCNNWRYDILALVVSEDTFDDDKIDFRDNDHKTVKNTGDGFDVVKTNLPVARNKTAVATFIVNGTTCKECRYVRGNAEVNTMSCPKCQRRNPETEIRTEWVPGTNLKIGVQQTCLIDSDSRDRKTFWEGEKKQICWYNSSGFVEGSDLLWKCYHHNKCKCWNCSQGAESNMIYDDVGDLQYGYHPDRLEAGSEVTVVLADENIIFLHNGEQVGKTFPLPEACSEIELFVGLGKGDEVTIQAGKDQTQIQQQQLHQVLTILNDE